jgi:hypothetical protein
MSDTAFLIIFPLLFFILFPLLWIGITGILAHVSGWALLARRFTAEEPDNGRQIRHASALIQQYRLLPVTYKGSLFFTVSKEGVYLSVSFLFRFLSPPLFIPWSAIESVTEQRHLFGSYGVINIRNCPVKILAMGPAGQSLLAPYSAP